MRLHSNLLVAAAILLSVAATMDTTQAKTAEVVTPNSPLADSVLAGNHSGEEKRFLRTDDTEDDYEDDDDNDDEERGWLSSLKIKAWVKLGEDPQSVYKKLGLKGLPLSEAEKRPEYLIYLKFSKKWWQAQ